MATDEETARLWARCRRMAERAGLDEGGELMRDVPFPPASEVALAASTLHGIAFEAYRADGGPTLAVERVAVRLSHRALAHARALQRSEDLARAWRVHQQQRQQLSSADVIGEPSATSAPLPAGVISSAVARQLDEAFRMSKRFKPCSADVEQHEEQVDAAHHAMPAIALDESDESDGRRTLAARRSRASAAMSAFQTGRTTYVNALGGTSLEPNAYREALLSLPPTIPVPTSTASAICASLQPVLVALDHGLDYRSHEYRAATNAYNSWSHTSWIDTRSSEDGEGGRRTKPAKGWTVEQYGMPGFAGRYARELHIARVATLRQLMLWLLESAPGLPTDGPLSIGDLGAGTCAACLGARFATRDYSGGEHPYRCWPIDVASSSARFRDAWCAMVAADGASGRSRAASSKDALLPGQSASQYLTEERDGVGHLMSSLLQQIASRGERQPHVVIASFSLHYLRGDEREAFYARLAQSVSRPMLLLIVKGVDSEAGRKRTPVVPAHVPSSFLGVHYYLGKDPKPRVVEAHVALVLPADAAARHSSRHRPAAADEVHYPGDSDVDALSGDPPSYYYDRENPDSWVLSTFAALQRRYLQQGLYTGVTELVEAEKRACTWF